MSTRISRPQTGYGIGDFLNGVQIENEQADAPRSPQKWQVRHGVSDAGKARAEGYAEQANSNTWQSRTERAMSVEYTESADADTNAIIEAKRRHARLQAEVFLARRSRGAKTL